MNVRRTFVCRPDVDAKGQPSCSGGGYWTDDHEDTPPRHRCGKRMTELAPTYVAVFGGQEGRT